jgi:hypothetical protein
MIKLKPELNSVRYWIHIVLIAIIVKTIMGLFGYCSGCATCLDFMMILKLSGAIVVGDIIAHTLLNLD